MTSSSVLLGARDAMTHSFERFMFFENPSRIGSTGDKES